jgi:hypothetical protein
VRIEDTWGYQRDEAIRQVEEWQAAIRRTIAAHPQRARPFLWLYFKVRMWGVERNYKKLMRQRDGP